MDRSKKTKFSSKFGNYFMFNISFFNGDTITHIPDYGIIR